MVKKRSYPSLYLKVGMNMYTHLMFALKVKRNKKMNQHRMQLSMRHSKPSIILKKRNSSMNSGKTKNAFDITIAKIIEKKRFSLAETMLKNCNETYLNEKSGPNDCVIEVMS